ncbi:MAG: choice-of-anchor L domain-containing protein [Byssovorax sp.]
MSKGTRSVGRWAAMIAPVLAAVIAASCGGGGTTTSTATGGKSTGTTGSGGGGGANVGGSGGATSSTGSSASTGIVDPSCVMDADCVNDPKGKVCDPQTGQCVACLPTNDVCAKSEFCDPATNTCKPGCSNDADCDSGGPVMLHCDLTTNSCAGCLNDSDCPPGNVCAPNQVCVPGCSPMQPCAAGQKCCGTSCYDTTKNVNNCGDCDIKCPVPANAVPVCVGSICGMGTCDPAYANCNGQTNDGCEQNILQEGPCACAPGTTQTCYQGGPGTVGVGACKAGTQTCAANGTAWGPCTAQVLPKPEICGNQTDDDCDGIVDNVSDADGDGWTTCNGDCCDSPGPGCPSPAQINPGAFEVVGNGVDDDCDPSTSDINPATACAPAAKFATVTSLDVAQAMDICQTTTANAPLPTKKWGLISSQQILPNNVVPTAAELANIQNNQTALLTDYGAVIVPHKGPTMAGISSGYMRDQTDPLPTGQAQFTPPNGGKAFTAAVSFTPIPSPLSPLGFYLSKHAGGLPASVGCNVNGCPAGSGANDPASVQLKIRVPTNANSFSYDFRFFSAEFQSFQCTTFNDFYLAILTSQAPGIPADHNISFDSLKNAVSVNNGFFQVCVPKGGACGACPFGNSELALTGMQLNNTGGGTTWLTTDAPVLPGETITLDLMIFDVSDHLLDSLTLLDNFRWNVQTAVVGTHM